MHAQNPDIADALVRAGFPADTPTTRLAGLTNVNHLLEHDGSKFVLRIPGAGTSEYIDRTTEAVVGRPDGKPVARTVGRDLRRAVASRVGRRVGVERRRRRCRGSPRREA